MTTEEKTKQVFDTVTCFGSREMTFERFMQAVREMMDSGTTNQTKIRKDMAQLNIVLNVEKVWLREYQRWKKCYGCGTDMYGDILRLWLMSDVNGIKSKAEATDIFICEDCFKSIKT
jgi:hypothetical protein